jgi:hypothetical protein
MTIWLILRPIGIIYGLFGIFPRFGMLHHEKSGNPAAHRKKSDLSAIKVIADKFCNLPQTF